ncbi:unnamed protein product [Somion occarium]|uniref:Urease accessory protein UreD n=1 Tax=Somion occarium TaxID=3059160 RepID=A0ABP1CHZ5_9APHY
MQTIGPGVGRIVLRPHGSEAVFSELSYAYPLKLLSPKVSQRNTAVVYVLSYGGGLVGGDQIKLSVEVHDGSSLVMLSQGSTKVFKTRPGHQLAQGQNLEMNDLTCQHFDIEVSPGSSVFLLPDPVTCFRSAKYNQVQKFRLSGDASAVLLDWITSGRKSLGEEWVFNRYYSLNELWVDGKRIARDAMLLEEEIPIQSVPTRTLADRLQPYSCYATVLMYGPLTQAISRTLTAEFEAISVFKQHTRPSLIWSISPISEGEGCVLRVAAGESEDVRRWLGRALRPLEGIIGMDIYRRAFA